MAKGDYYLGDGYLKWDVGNVQEGLLNFAWASRGKLLKYLEQEAVPELENYMRANRPWQDRTGKAKEGLTAEAYSYGSFDSSEFSAGVMVYHRAYNDRNQPYGEYLEKGTSYNPRTGRGNRPYPILEPTVRNKGPEIIQNMRGLLERVGFYG